MTSTSYDGSYSLTLYFKVGSDKNINLMNVQNRIQQVQSQLPEDVQRTGVTAISRTSGSGAIILTLYPESGNWTQLDLTNYGSIYIKDELKRVEGVADVEVYGGGNYSMRIWLDPEKMAGLGISTSEVKNAISTQNTQVTAGALGQLPTDEKNALQLTLKTQGRLDEVEQFENIIIRSNMDGSNVRIKDIARVELGAESYSNLGLVNGKPSAVVIISQLPDANVINLSKAVKEKVDDSILVPLLGKWDSAEDIDFSNLPEKFVIRPNNGSYDTVICKNKSDTEVCKNPLIADASNGIPQTRARSSAPGIIETLRSTPNISVKNSFINFTSFSSTYCIISFSVYFIFYSYCIISIPNAAVKHINYFVSTLVHKYCIFCIVSKADKGVCRS